MKLLQSQEYLQAVLQFAAHVQTLKDKEHRLLGKSMVPMAERDPQACWIGHSSRSDPVRAVTLQCRLQHVTLAVGAAICWQSIKHPLDMQAPDETVIVPVLCYAQVRMLEMAWILVSRRMKQGRLRVVSRASHSAVACLHRLLLYVL